MITDILIIIISLLSSIIIPYIIYRKIKSTKFDPEKETLSYLSNKTLFGRKMSEGYTEVLFALAIFTLVFFWLLIKKLNFTADHAIWEWLIIAIFSLILLAFAHHNMVPFKRQNLYLNIIRIIHNLLAAMVFISLPVLMIRFDHYFYQAHEIVSLVGYIVVAITLIATLSAIIIMRKMTGIAEMIFIIGISLWNILTGLAVVL